MAVVNASFALSPRSGCASLFPLSSIPSASSSFFRIPSGSQNFNTRSLLSSVATKNELIEAVDNRTEETKLPDEPRETLLYSFSPLPLLFVTALPGAAAMRSLFGPFVELVKSWNLPDWLVHWGHPGNMAVVLFAMGGYGTYLGFRIRYSDDAEEKAKAKDLHPKLLGGMFFFFALGATGGITSLLTSDKPIFERYPSLTFYLSFLP
uniref:Uncharacterized protein n=1 Tax=Rhizophora mucronata TaxID=61149 RepID=A0A2P2JT34_RHIMU